MVGAYLSTTFPSLSTKNLVKFHLMPSPNIPPFWSFKNLYSGAAFFPLTSTYNNYIKCSLYLCPTKNMVQNPSRRICCGKTNLSNMTSGQGNINYIQPRWFDRCMDKDNNTIAKKFIPVDLTGMKSQYKILRNMSLITMMSFRKNTLSKIGNSALNLVHTTSWISSLVPGSCPANWLHGNAKISNPGENLRPHCYKINNPIQPFNMYILLPLECIPWLLYFSYNSFNSL